MVVVKMSLGNEYAYEDNDTADDIQRVYFLSEKRHSNQNSDNWFNIGKDTNFACGEVFDPKIVEKITES